MPNIPRAGGTTLSLVCSLPADHDQPREQRLVESLRGEDHAVDALQLAVQVLELVERELGALAEHLDVDVGEELELAPRRVGERPVPRMSVRSGGVVARHSSRVPLRKSNAAAERRRPAPATALVGGMPPAGVAWRKSVSAAVPVSAQRKMLWTSSAVTWRSARWSRS